MVTTLQVDDVIETDYAPELSTKVSTSIGRRVLSLHTSPAKHHHKASAVHEDELSEALPVTQATFYGHKETSGTHSAAMHYTNAIPDRQRHTNM